MVARSTYSQVDFSAFGDFLGKHPEEIQDGGVTLDVVTQ